MTIYKARVPTNIAFLKYWGKSDEQTQWPANDSLSMTLDLYTETLASLSPIEETSHALSFRSDQDLAKSPLFLQKGLRHLKFLSENLGFEDALYLQTYNEFPSGCGIASSASGLASLTLAALAAWTGSSSFEELEEKGFARERLAHLARLGSGSACRSFWGGFVHWEKGLYPESQKTHPIFPETHWALRDCVVILSDAEKSMTSTDGHKLASTSPLFQPRLELLGERLLQMREALARCDMNTLGPLLEQEAIEMHELMATSNPPCVYMTQSTVSFLGLLARERMQTKIPMYFTLDAGPNVHVIYEEAYKEKVQDLFKDYKTIDVSIGSGPSLSLV